MAKRFGMRGVKLGIWVLGYWGIGELGKDFSRWSK